MKKNLCIFYLLIPYFVYSTNSLNGIWVNSEFINKLEKTKSISKSEKNYNFYLSILIENNNIKALSANQMESNESIIEDNSTYLAGVNYKIEKINSEELYLISKSKKVKFIKVKKEFYDKDDYVSTFTGLDFLHSFLIRGNYLDNQTESTIEFGVNNNLLGFLDYKKYYASAHFNKDIVIFRKFLDGRAELCFIIHYEKNKILLEEVEPIEDFDVKELTKTGKRIVLIKK